MVNLIKVELKKLKGSNALWIGLAGCFILPLMSLFVGTSVTRSNSWRAYCTESMWMSVLLLWPCIFGFIGTYIFTRERIENTYKNLLIIPVGRIPLILSKLFILFIVIIGMTLLSYVLNISGIFIGVKINLQEFISGILTYLLCAVLTFIAMLPVLLVAFISKKGFLLSVCVTFIYALLSFIGIWSPVLSSVMPIISILRICNITALSIEYAYPITINLISMAAIGLVSFIGILYAALKQEA